MKSRFWAVIAIFILAFASSPIGCSKHIEPGPSVTKERNIFIVQNLDKGSVAGFSVGDSLGSIEKAVRVMKSKEEKSGKEDVIILTAENALPEAFKFRVDIVNQGPVGDPADGFTPYSYGENRITLAPSQMQMV